MELAPRSRVEMTNHGDRYCFRFVSKLTIKNSICPNDIEPYYDILDFHVEGAMLYFRVRKR